ncbi:formylglycine-generating enzyme required for sulfatase activity [Pseudomonas alcaligenes]|nr:formylglycine-generating enzyme required for sulfatase activity [Pseudomonas alcaligenes]
MRRTLLLALSLLPLAALAQQAGERLRDSLPEGAQGPELVIVPAGEFLMGDATGRGNDNERPTHRVTIDKPFAIGRFELTFDDWQRYASATGKPMPDNEGWGLSGQRPVIHVSWFDARAYCDWLSSVTGQRYRLPTEAEWEYAARAGGTGYYGWGDELDSSESAPRAHCRGCGTPNSIRGKTAQVGQYPANAFGLHDTAGNVWEWTASRFAAPFDGSEAQAAALLDRSPRVVRGGAWNSGPAYLRTSLRDLKQPGHDDYALGFRVLRELD